MYAIRSYYVQDSVRREQVPEFPLFSGQGEGAPLRFIEKRRQVPGAVVMGVPPVHIRYLPVRGDAAAESLFFHEKSQALQVRVLDGVVPEVEDQGFREHAPAGQDVGRPWSYNFV